MEPAISRQAFDSGDRGTVLHDRKCQTGHHSAAVDEYGACTTLAMVAALFSTCEIEIFAEEV
jgi:hypothetical protein